MKDLDKYFSTPDGYFNEEAQWFILDFSGGNNPETTKPFEQWIEAIHELYFFIQEQPNKPFALMEKVKQLSKANKFTTNEQVLFLDKVLVLLRNQPNDIGTIAYMRLIDCRNELRPFIDEPTNWHFDKDSLKQEFEALETPKERKSFLLNTLLDIKTKAPELSELEQMYYSEIGLINWIETELTRLKLAPVLQNEGAAKAEPMKPQPPTDKNRTSDLIREKLSTDDEGWNYFFKNETDYNQFVELFTLHFEFKDYTLPETPIQLKHRCKTKVATLLKELHSELKDETLKHDKKYFTMIEKLSPFTNEADLYKTISR